jgi:hypothetical protein
MKQSETKRQRLLEFFRLKDPVWKNEDHPESKDGAAAWGMKPVSRGFRSGAISRNGDILFDASA